MSSQIRLLFVCLGNICRSPVAECVFRAQVEARGVAHRFEIDSAGTSGYHDGNPPDARSRETARLRGVEVTGKSRKLESVDLERFDYIIVMDRENLANTLPLRKASNSAVQVRRLREWDPEPGDGDVPDPYYGGPEGFDEAHDIIERSCAALLEDLLTQISPA